MSDSVEAIELSKDANCFLTFVKGADPRTVGADPRTVDGQMRPRENKKTTPARADRVHVRAHRRM